MRDDKISAGLPGSRWQVNRLLRLQGIDPERLSIFFLGERLPRVRWLRQLVLGAALWLATQFAGEPLLPVMAAAGLHLLAGFLILHGACQALIKSSVWMAARWRLSHYMAGTLVEITGTVPELVLIGFLAVHTPMMALITTLVTVYNNALLFSLYSFFLPKNHQNKYVMPVPITEAGTQVLIAGSVMAVSCGFALLIFSTTGHPKQSFHALDLTILAVGLLTIFVVYMIKLLRESKAEEAEVHQTLQLDEEQVEDRKALVYRDVEAPGLAAIIAVFLLALGSAFAGGYLVAGIAEVALHQLHMNLLLTSILLAFFAGMSEVVLLLSAHRQREYGIALANAFGGIIQVLLLVLPVTLLAVALRIWWLDGALALPIERMLVFLVVFLFPLFYLLAALLEEDHTFDLLDASIMTVMILFMLILLATYGY